MTNTLLSAQTFLSALPEEIPVFPFLGTVLLPHARLPLNVSDPRHLAMVEDSLGKGRLIGLIQPTVEGDHDTVPLYSVGCVGRITSFNEVDNGHMLIVLSGVCRFRIASELPRTRPYRVVKPEWTPYLSDLGDIEPVAIDRERLIELMKIYFKKNAITVDWSIVKNAPDDVLLPTIVMICPLAPNEKQALLEAENFAVRAQMLMALLEMAAMPQNDIETEIKH
ncbi:MAG: LON peptidase substrate-binding domain-containing protein [Alphaproteobacteria bacterium]|nr:LON peptidase substrate-binding domain-containing protein [Alphaproteobacteria bacterium]